MMMTMAVVVGVLGIKWGTMLSNGEYVSGNNEMSKDSKDDNNDGIGGGVRDKRGDNAKQLRRFERQ